MSPSDIPDVSGETIEATPAAAPETPAGRDKRGRFQKGAPSANPKGRPTESHEMKELARDKSKEAIARLVFWMRSNDPTASIAAAKELLSRGFGRPEQGITLDAIVSTGPIIVDFNSVSAIDAMATYQELMRAPTGTRFNLTPSAPAAQSILPPPPPRPALVPPQPISRAEPPETVQAPTSREPPTVAQEFIPADPAPSSKEQKTRELWERLGRPANPEEGIAALDAILRTQRKPYIVT